MEARTIKRKAQSLVVGANVSPVKVGFPVEGLFVGCKVGFAVGCFVVGLGVEMSQSRVTVILSPFENDTAFPSWIVSVSPTADVPSTQAILLEVAKGAFSTMPGIWIVK